MPNRSFKKIIEGIFVSPIFISFIVFLLATFVVYRLTIYYVDSAYNKEFIRDVLVEAHGMLFDLLIIGTFIFALHILVQRRREKRSDIKRWHEEIDDLRGCKTEEAKHRIIGNIKRLNGNGITQIFLHNCYLKKATFYSIPFHEMNFKRKIQRWTMPEVNLSKSIFSYANLEEASLTQANLQLAALDKTNLKKANLRRATFFRASLQGADLKDADLFGADFRNADLRTANLGNANLEEADFRNADLLKVNLIGANFNQADLRGIRNITIEQFSKVKTLYKAKLDLDRLEQIKVKYPHLFEKPMEE